MLNFQRKCGLLKEAYLHAAEFSPDLSTQNAAILIGRDGHVILKSVNKFPAGVQQTPERWERPLKYAYVEHAERNLIYTAAWAGVSTYGKIMICPWFACADCARAIVVAGIEEVIGNIVTGKQVNIPVPMCSAMWGRRRLAQPTVGYVGSSL